MAIIDGRAIAHDILSETKQMVSKIGRTPLVRAVVMEPTPATESYLRIKAAKAKEAGMGLEVVRLQSSASEEDILHAIADSAPDALIVQLPLPASMDELTVLNGIPVEKDADVLSAAAYERFLAGDPDALLPPVVCAIAEILKRWNVAVSGKSVVVVGQGRLVGQPVAAWMAGEDALVTTITKETFDEQHGALKEADIVISGAGNPHFIQPDMVKKGAVLIDAGTSESGGAIVGDFDPACEEAVSVFTPVPGGVGPIAVACLFENVARLLKP